MAVTEVQLAGGRGWLDAGAAASLDRIDQEIGHLLQITEAGRSYARQLEHWNTYQRVGYPIALHPDTPSIHQLGNAIDTDERITAVLNDHGWFHTVYRNGVLVEPWHYEYDPKRDNHITMVRGTDGVWRWPGQEEDDMTPEQDKTLTAAFNNAKSALAEISTTKVAVGRIESKLTEVTEDADLAARASKHALAEIKTTKVAVGGMVKVLAQLAKAQGVDASAVVAEVDAALAADED